MWNRKWCQALLLLCLLPELALSQRGQQGRTLVINGQSGQAAVIQMNGRSYVDVEALARLSHGTLAFKGNQIILTLPATSAASAVAAAPQASAAPAAGAAPVQALGFSKPFLRASIEAMGQIMEWRSALSQAVQGSLPVTQDSIGVYSGRAAQSARLATVAVSTSDDRQADQFIGNELRNMQMLSQKFIDARSNQQEVPQDSLEGDPLFQKILTCAHAISGMQAGNQFQDDNSCH